MHYSVKKWGRQRVQSLGESPKSPLWSTRTMQARGRGRPGGVTGAPGPMTSAPRWGVYPIFFLIEQLFEGTDLVRFQFQKEHFGSRMTMLIRGGYTVTERANPNHLDLPPFSVRVLICIIKTKESEIFFKKKSSYNSHWIVLGKHF